jgi:hypothetical protein
MILPWRARHASSLLPKATVAELGSILDQATELGKTIFGPKDNPPNQSKSDSDRPQGPPEGLKDLLGGKKKQ